MMNLPMPDLMFAAESVLTYAPVSALSVLLSTLVSATLLVDMELLSALADLLILSLWQGALVAAVAVMVLAMLRTARPVWRYGAAVIALVVILVLPLITAVLPSRPMASASPELARPVASPPAPEPPMPMALRMDARMPDPALEGSSSAKPEEGSIIGWVNRAAVHLAEARATVDAAAPIWLTIWGLGVIALMVRMAGGVWWVRHLRASARPLPERWTSVVASAVQQTGLTISVPVRCSPRVEVPLVCGWRRPMVIVPERLLDDCPSAELEALLVHELSHVRRHDVLVGWGQTVAETILFFHPGVWWLSGRIRRERELSTDDRVLRSGVVPRTYAKALTRVAERATALRPPRGVALAPAASDGALLHRIRRVVLPEQREPVRRASLLVAALTLLIVPFLASACSSPKSAQPAGTEPTNEEVTTIIVPEGASQTPGDVEGTVVVDSLTVRSGTTDVQRIIIRKDTAWIAQLDSLEGLSRFADSTFADNTWRKRVLAFALDADSLAEVIELELGPMNRALEEHLRGLDTLTFDGFKDFKSRERLEALKLLDSMRLGAVALDSMVLGRPRIYRFDVSGDSAEMRSMEERAEMMRRQAEMLRRQAEEMERRAEEMERRRERDGG